MIRIFKTNVQKKKDALRLLKKMHACFPTGKINFDLQDCDRILRIELVDHESDDIITIVNEAGFSCVEIE